MIGETVGNYKVLRQLGEGGMGVVYLAEHTVIGKQAALKMLLPTYCKNEAIVTRFFNEARATAKIQHPGLIEVYDFGHHSDGSAYIVMEFLDGESLAAKLKREGAFALPMVIELARQVAMALQAAHAQGIVHRDLKPDNVLLVKSEELKCGLRAKVLDFGIAKLIDHASSSNMKTRTGVMMGTPAYMSPEQCRGASRVDQRADVYSLGCMMFQMASGAPPFAGEGLGEVIAAHLSEPVPPLVVAPQLEPVVQRALAKNADERYQNMAELLTDLDALLMRRPLAPRPEKTELTERGPGKMIAAVAVVALAMAGIGGGYWYTRSHRAGEAQAPAAAVAPAGAAAAPAGAAPVGGANVGGANVGGANVGGANVGGANVGGANVPGAVGGAPVAAAPVGGATAPGAAAIAPAAVPAPALPAVVRLTIESTPPGAQVFRVADGVHVGQTPYSVEIQRGSGEAQFVLKLSGYRDATASLPINHDTDQTIVLARAAPPSRSSTRVKNSSKPAAEPAHAAAVAPPPPEPPPQQPASHSIRNGELHGF